MNKSKLACLVACIALCLAIFSGLVNPQAIVKAEGEQASLPEGKIELSCKYPMRPGTAVDAFEFEVELSYSGGEEPRTFELSATALSGWTVNILQSPYERTKHISAIRLDPKATYKETILVSAMASWKLPEPGDYTMKLEAAAGEIKGSIDLTARVTANYNFMVRADDYKLDIKAKPGKESYLSLTVTNIGTATLKEITFSSSEPSGFAGEEWSVTFEPNKIESLDSWDSREVKVAIRPPSKAIAGDYFPVTLRFNSDPSPSTLLPELDVRVRVEVSTKWGWIGAGIVIAVIAGLVVGFRRLGRR